MSDKVTRQGYEWSSSQESVVGTLYSRKVVFVRPIRGRPFSWLLRPGGCLGWRLRPLGMRYCRSLWSAIRTDTPVSISCAPTGNPRQSIFRGTQCCSIEIMLSWQHPSNFEPRYVPRTYASARCRAPSTPRTASIYGRLRRRGRWRKETGKLDARGAPVCQTESVRERERAREEAWSPGMYWCGLWTESFTVPSDRRTF